TPAFMLSSSSTVIRSPLGIASTNRLSAASKARRPLVDELKDGRGRKGFGDAGDAEVIFDLDRCAGGEVTHAKRADTGTQMPRLCPASWKPCARFRRSRSGREPSWPQRAAPDPRRRLASAKQPPAKPQP